MFSLTWPVSMQIYWNKRKRLHKKRVQLPKDWFGTPTWPPFHCFGAPIWPPWRHVKTLYCFNIGWHYQNRALRGVVVRILNIEITERWIFASDFPVCVLCWCVGYIFEAPYRLFVCLKTAVVLVGKNKNFSLRCFLCKSCGKNCTVLTTSKAAFSRVCKQRKGRNSFVTKTRWLGKYACYRRLQNSGDFYSQNRESLLVEGLGTKRLCKILTLSARFTHA